MKNQIIPFSYTGNSQIDGKTIKHAFYLQYIGVFIGFVDNTWFLIEKTDTKYNKIGWSGIEDNISYYSSIDDTNYIINNLTEVGVITTDEGEKLSKKLKDDRRKRLEGNIESYSKTIENMKADLKKLEP